MGRGTRGREEEEEEERLHSPFGGNGAYWTQNSVSRARQRIFKQLFLLGAVRFAILVLFGAVRFARLLR